MYLAVVAPGHSLGVAPVLGNWNGNHKTKS